jgi:Transglutaminase-like superfamily
MFSANIVPVQDVNYYAIQNSFIHFALQGLGSLPITLGIIFTAIATRCGISASPINYVTLPTLWTKQVNRLARSRIRRCYIWDVRGLRYILRRCLQRRSPIVVYRIIATLRRSRCPWT